MKALHWKPLIAAGLIVVGVLGCESELPTSPNQDLSEAASSADSPGALLGILRGGGSTGDPVRLVPVRKGARVTPDDAILAYLEGSLSFPTQVTKVVDGKRYLSFKFGPSGLRFSPAAILAISTDKADLRGIDPRRLRIAVASDTAEDWRIVGGIYDPVTRTVIAPVLHFSRYALCVD